MLGDRGRALAGQRRLIQARVAALDTPAITRTSYQPSFPCLAWKPCHRSVHSHWLVQPA